MEEIIPPTELARRVVRGLLRPLEVPIMYYHGRIPYRPKSYAELERFHRKIARPMPGYEYLRSTEIDRILRRMGLLLY